MESLKNFRNSRLFKWGKAFLIYFTIFFFTQWLQMIGLALLFPWGGGEFHVLLQLDGPESFKGFLPRVYASYLLVGLLPAYLVSCIKREPHLLAICLVSAIVPIMRWHLVLSLDMADSFRLYLVLLGMFIPFPLLLASFLGKLTRAWLTVKSSRRI